MKASRRSRRSARPPRYASGPITMTALAAFFALVPGALAIERGSEANAPLARAILGGLLAGEPATLFVLPVIYTLLVKESPKDRAERAARHNSGHEPVSDPASDAGWANKEDEENERVGIESTISRRAGLATSVEPVHAFKTQPDCPKHRYRGYQLGVDTIALELTYNRRGGDHDRILDMARLGVRAAVHTRDAGVAIQGIPTATRTATKSRNWPHENSTLQSRQRRAGKRAVRVARATRLDVAVERSMRHLGRIGEFAFRNELLLHEIGLPSAPIGTKTRCSVVLKCSLSQNQERPHCSRWTSLD